MRCRRTGSSAWLVQAYGGGGGRPPLPSLRSAAGGRPSPPGGGQVASMVGFLFGSGAALRVRLALRIDDLLQLAQHVHAGKELLQAGVGLALLPDRRDELAVLELDAVH